MTALSIALQNFFSEYFPDESSFRVLVGVSGGPDSLALLHSLYSLDLPQLEIQVAHLNHLIRGKRATADATYVQEFCARLGLICTIAEYDVPEFAENNHLSIEDAARRARFAFFAHLMYQEKLPLLLLAHNADDQAETLLLRLLRGTGPHGLAGIAPLASLPPPDLGLLADFPSDPDWLKQARVGRPLLEMWRSEIESYCAQHSLEPRQDETNAQPDYARNRVRLELLPMLEKEYKPGLKKNLARLAQLMHDEQSWLDDLTHREFEKSASISPNRVEFEQTYFRGQSAALQRRLLRQAYFYLNHSLENLAAADLEPFLTVEKFTAYLPAGLIAYSDATKIGLYRPEVIQPLEGQHELALPGSLDLGLGWKIEAEILLIEQISLETIKSADKNTAYFDYESTGKHLLIRARQAGEKFRPLGAPGRRKVQDLMLDAKITVNLRNSWPLVVCPVGEDGPSTTEAGKIVWLPGVALADEYKVTGQTAYVLVLRFIG